MATAKKDAVTERHLLLFGRIIQSFAAHELLMERIMAHVTGDASTAHHSADAGPDLRREAQGPARPSVAREDAARSL